MEVNVNKLRQSIQWIREHVQSDSLSPADNRVLEKFSELKQYGETDIIRLIQWLSEHLLNEAYTEQIAVNFEEFLLLILSKSIGCGDDNKTEKCFAAYQTKCLALAKLVRLSADAKRYATDYFHAKPAPFENNELPNEPPTKKVKSTKTSKIPPSKLAILKCCYQLLSADPAYYKELWNWSTLVETFSNSTENIPQLEQLYFNHILRILTNMSNKQLSELNSQIPSTVLLQFDEEQNNRPKAMDFQFDEEQAELITFNFQSEFITNVEGVLLPIFNKENYKFYTQTDGVHDQIVKVDSTKVNLRSIALGIAAAKTICLSGPVGCGKTTLVQYLARKTGRICPKTGEIEKHNQNNKENGKQKNGIASNSQDLEESITDLLNLETKNINGFLRIQLGDQTDSKMLLGQYRCTDVPGEFIWLPGILTQAVMNGYWLLLEDLDSATQDTYTILSGLLENNYLSVPGFRDCVKIKPGFQLFVTVRTNKSSTNSAQKALFSLLEKYLYTINILPLSRNELCKVVGTNYPKLATVANRIVDVFLTFSSGDHNVADNLRQQETHDKADNAENYVALPFEAVSLDSVPNAGRLVSTRDLIKLCQRSNPVFSVTSTECAYFVFQNAVDVFCSNLPQGKEKTKLIVSIGAKLGIIQSRCETYADDYKPEVTLDSKSIKVGRAELCTKYNNSYETVDIEDVDDLGVKTAKRAKLSHEAEQKIYEFNRNTKRVTFSFTRLASCLLERIAVCVSHAEPVLLVGETGVGKTSSVQYLGERTQHKLVVVNMNNQSDVSDLVGGFKPVDLTYVLAPLRTEFETLFCKTYDSSKNAMFFNKLSTCYNDSIFTVIVKMMIKVADSVLLKSERNEMPEKIIHLLPQWQLIKAKLLKLDSQLAKSINISFAFIPGSLVNCIKNGDWVLLDEINLASAETLECLSTILEPDGSVVLLEKGDFTPVRRHSDFRIFACMNPNTDIGKKDLPVGIRNRFTEFFVDELTTDNDLSLLISDYLSNTGIQRKSVTSIVKLYKKLRQLAKLELNDGLGNRPVYSLRTLCRSLRICAKNLCGSIERNLYESFCLSFLTQLDADSHKIVLQLIQTALLSNVKAVLRQSIPKPGENYQDFEGYWIQNGPKPLQECANYILTDSVKANLKDLSRIISIGKLPILLQGPTSAGKTSLIEYVAKRSGNHCLRINNHEHTDLQEYIGTYVADVSGKLSFREGILVQAMRNGYWIILDELNLASTEILEALNRVLDDNRELFIPETQTVVKAHPNFMLFATQNPPGLYGGRKTLSRAFKNRFIELHFSEIPRQELETILERRCLIPASYAKKMVMCMSDLQKNRKTTSKNVFTLRDLFRWGNRYTYADKRLLEDKLYDWNQHLVEEGYLVLSAKVRTVIEIEIIEDALYRNFKKRIDLARLFDVQVTEGQSSSVTADIMEAIRSFRARSDIVWTRNMTRMAVLTAKALQFDEPVLLVGPTGCGKTTVCQLLASIRGVQLRILNCHMHTEGADFLGGLRPYRQHDNDGDDDMENAPSQRKLFEWADGPLINAMQEGSYFMADEISLAEDSVLERLNCILEPERTVLLAEKGGVAEEGEKEASLEVIANDFVVQAKDGFQFLATMNPGGDFGKKELSPALRNRFTEIWCLPSDAKEDLIQIAGNCMSKELAQENAYKIAAYLVEVVLYMSHNVEKFKFSVRDILAWAHYMVTNARLSFPERAIFGLETIFLDALEMLPHESITQIDQQRAEITRFAIKCAEKLIGEKFTAAELEVKRGQVVLRDNGLFGLKPFLIPINSTTDLAPSKDFSFSAPTTKKNLFRLLSALSLQKPILLEGPPGVGKTSTVESLAKAIGFQIVRINLCEHTDLADLFGTDLPAEDNVLNTSLDHPEETNETTAKIGTFVWRDGPLLAALKAENTWILLDELNLAPQSVLEGLNAVLDHRGEVFIPELNKSFTLNKSTRIFACQNPLKQGGGRKGLPQSFLNRFNKVYLRKLTTEDLRHVVNEKYGSKFEELKTLLVALLEGTITSPTTNLFDLRNNFDDIFNSNTNSSSNEITYVFDLSDRLVKFSEALDCGVALMEFGYKGGPYEFNLRDILRWCDFLIDKDTGVHFSPTSTGFVSNFDSFLQTLYDTMKLVYIARMRTPQDQVYIRQVFGRIFNCAADNLSAISDDVSLYWTDENLYLNDLVLKRNEISSSQRQLRGFTNIDRSPLLLSTQRENLQNVIACVQHQKPVLICGATDTGKTKLIDALCTLSNKICNTDNIDDSVTGSFQQIDLNRHLEDLSLTVEGIFWSYVQKLILELQETKTAAVLLNDWYKYVMIGESYKLEINQASNISKELILFRKRIQHLIGLIQQLLKANLIPNEDVQSELERVFNSLHMLQNYTRSAESLNMGGSFEWVDSKIVKSLKYGQYIALEHVNLCSSAILDRLNPVFEPNGNLLISEKGVSATDTAEIVEKSPNFRAFLTIDPRNGELSRAMRNRCVELALQKDVFSIDDMRQIIHAHGVHDIIAINCMLWMHNCMKELTEINNYSISHLNQYAFLVASYKRIGYATSRALYVSGMEVYVYSANVDLLGYGLEYYQNKLREIVLEHMKQYMKSIKGKQENNHQEDWLVDTILRCDALNEVTMIKQQVTPLKVLLHTTAAEANSALTLYFKDFENLTDISMENYENLKCCYIYLLYESSTIADLELRYHYLEKVLATQPELQLLSKYLYECIKKCKTQLSNDLPQLPWNYKLYSRIRDYAQRTTLNENIPRISGLLISRLILKLVPTTQIANIHNASALQYAHAISKRIVIDKTNNELLKSLSNLFYYLTQSIESMICVSNLDETKLVELSTRLLWFNRFLSLAETQLFIRKDINRNLVDKLMLHYEWLCKHLLTFFAQITGKSDYQEFDEIFGKLNQYIAKVKPKLNRLRKLYVKRIMTFQPYYKEEQVRLQNLTQQLDNLLGVVPFYGSYTPENIQRKFITQRKTTAKKARAIITNSKSCGVLVPDMKPLGDVPQSIRYVFENYQNSATTHKEEEITDLEGLSQEIAIIHKEINSQEELLDTDKPNEIELGIFAMREYYLTKVLVEKVANIWDKDGGEINLMYCEEIPTLSNDTWQLLKLYNEERYDKLLRVLNDLMKYVQNLNGEGNDSFSDLLNGLNGDYKEFNATWRCIVYKCYKRQLNNLAARFSCTQVISNSTDELHSEARYEGPTLVNACLSLLYQSDGHSKPVPLKDLDAWKCALQQLRALLWQNTLVLAPTYNDMENNHRLARLHAEKLLLEVRHNGIWDADENYKNLVENLEIQISSLTEEEKTATLHSALRYQQRQYKTAMLNALIGAIELSTLTSTPLIDPVEKQRLKKMYLSEDIKSLTTLSTAYDYLRIVLKYRHFGEEFYTQLGKQIDSLKTKQMKQNQNVAVRPSECLYMKLVQDIEHFIATNCAPEALSKLLQLVTQVWENLVENFDATQAESAVEMCRETSSKLTLWIGNAQRFVHHVLKPYTGYYEDFLQSLYCGVQQFSFGLIGLKSVLCQLENSIVEETTGRFVNYKKNGHVHHIVSNFAEFPNTRVLKTTPKSGANLTSSSSERLRMLKLRLDALSQHLHMAAVISEEAFEFLNDTLSEYNQIWQIEEEQQRRRKAEEDSLYVHKTKCEDEDEAAVELAEIEENFPTNVEQDFGDYLNTDTLEQTKKVPKATKKPVTLLNDDQTAAMAQNFMDLIENYSRVSYFRNDKKSLENMSIDFLGNAKARFKTFATLFTRHKLALNDWLDEQAYNGICLEVTLRERQLSDIPNTALKSQQKSQKVYNFYKDSNITEIMSCMELLERIRALTQIQLDLYPEHATLLDIQQIISRICHLPSNAPLVRFSTGFQLLRQKVAQWNEIAHKHNHLRNEEIELAEYVQRWMRLELQCWRNCLNQTQNLVEARAYRYWFFVYNLLLEYLNSETLDNSYTDLNYAEKRFGEGEVLDSTDANEKNKVGLKDVMRILRQFIEASNYADFNVRMRMLQTFELYLQCSQDERSPQLEALVAGLHNLQIYFAQFAQEIAEFKQTMRTPIEKKLKEFVKIESYNKDLSYFSMRSNVARVHRQLNKFLKDYRQQLEQKITSVFQPQDATVKDYNFENNKGKSTQYNGKIESCLLIDVKHFIVTEKLRPPTAAIDETNVDSLLVKAGKHFKTARNVVKSIIQHATYTKMTMALDELLAAQLERCEHLRGLTVDRTKERPKQVLEAKQILQQKRKGLTDLFKTLAELGVSYKAGLMEQTLSTDFVDYTLPPFCVRNMICLDVGKQKSHIYKNMLQLYEHTDRYYAKSVFKLKLLQNIMLAPLSELGPPNIERIKGFAVSMFLLVQTQRRLLAETTRECYDLQRYLKQLRNLADIAAIENVAPVELNFDNQRETFEAVKRSTCHMRFILEQFVLLLDSVPNLATNTQQVFNNSTFVLTKDSTLYGVLTKGCGKILESVKSLLSSMTTENEEFMNYAQLTSFKDQHDTLVSQIEHLRETCKLPHKSEYIPLAKPLTSLLTYTSDTLNVSQRKDNEDAAPMDENDIYTNLDTELTNVIHNVLISLQKLYKQHIKPVEAKSAETEKPSNENNDDEDELELQDQHLKSLHNSLDLDWTNLNVSKVLKKLELILLSLKSNIGTTSKLMHIRRLATVVPLLEQYYLMMEYQLVQQLGSHKVASKMLSIMLTVFVEISTKGFCVPSDLLQDEEQGERKKDQKEGEGFGLEDGTGEKDASDKIESEDQLDDAKRPEDRKNEDKNEENQPDCKEEKGIDMSEDFDGKMQDIEKPEDEEDDSGKSEDEDELNKEMGETEEGAEKLDDQIWGDDEEPEEEEEDKDMEEDDGTGTKDEKDSHNDLDAKNDAAKNKDDTDEHDEKGLDATNETANQDKRKEQKPDIDNMKDPEVNEDQDNPYHNELEEPPEPEDMDLGDMNNNEEENENDQEDTENPFDIDNMKQNMPDAKDLDEADEGEEGEDKNENTNNDVDSEGSDDDGDEEFDKDKITPDPENAEDENAEEENDEEKENDEPETQKRCGLDEDEKDESKDDELDQTEKEESKDEHSASKDNASKEKNVQSMPDTDENATADQAATQEDDKNIKQEQKLDEQDTGEEKDGVGQAENEENDDGHQGIAETKETISKEDRKNEQQTKEKRKQGRTNEERSLGEAEKNKLKQLKTIEKLKEDESENKKEGEKENDEDEFESEEYQHVKEPKNSDKTTLDNATEEQSKQIQHQEDEKKDEDDVDATADVNEDMMDTDETENKTENEENLEEIAAERNEKKSEKPSKSDKTQERTETQEQLEIEGEIVDTITVPRNDDTTAHCNKEILLDTKTQAEEMSATQLLEMRKLYQQQMGSNKATLPQHEDYESWQTISHRMAQNARELCEQLRLILEPTKCTRLKGDYRTGRRINMKKIIPYIASQFRKDKIWLRRTKPAQRDYKITIAIDDSKSMHHNNSKTLTLEAISLVSQALTLLESGRLSVMSFGEGPKIILNHTEQFDGPKLVNSLNFSQDKTKIAELLDFIRTVNTEEGVSGADNGLFENLLLVLSDGRNIFSEGKAKVKNSIKLARLQRIFLVYIIIDNPENKNSILDIQTMEMLPDSRINIKSYLDDFPFPYYMIVRDLNQLPLVLSEAMRQWFELVNSEQ